MTSNIEKHFKEKIFYSIYIKDVEGTEKYYSNYIKYTRKTLNGKFDIDLQNNIMNKYAEFKKECFNNERRTSTHN